jgi:amino acid transporter
MWWWFIPWVILIWLLFSSFGYYGYRRSNYYTSWGPSGGIGLLIVLFIVFWLGNNFRRPVVGMVRLVVVTAPQGHSSRLTRGRQPSGQATAGLGDVLGWPGERQPHPAAAADRVKIETGGDRHPGVGQQPPA